MKIDVKILTDYKQTAIYTEIDKLDKKGVEKYINYQGGYFKILLNNGKTLFFQTLINDFLFSVLIRLPYLASGQSIITLNIPGKESHSLGIFSEKNELTIYEYKSIMHKHIESAKITQKIVVPQSEFIVELYSIIFAFNETRKEITGEQFIYWDEHLRKAKAAIDKCGW